MSAQASPLQFTLRAAGLDDAGFIVRPWLQELRKSPTSIYIDDPVYFERQRALIHRLIEACPTIVACSTANSEHAYGFICFSATAVHWCYVKSDFRLMGVGRTLFGYAKGAMRLEPADPVRCSHASGLFGLRSLRDRYRLQYDPYILRSLE